MPRRLLLAVPLVLTLAGCNGQATDPPVSVPVGVPVGVAPVTEEDTDPSTALPSGATVGNPITPDTGVVGVTHIVP